MSTITRQHPGAALLLLLTYLVGIVLTAYWLADPRDCQAQVRGDRIVSVLWPITLPLFTLIGLLCWLAIAGRWLAQRWRFERIRARLYREREAL